MERDLKRIRRSTDDTETPTVEELRDIFKKIPKENQLKKFIADIKENLHTKDADKLSEWDFHIQSGVKFLKFVNEYAGKTDARDATFQSGEGKQIMGSILKEIGNMHWAVAILSVIGYVVSKCAKMYENEKQCRELVQEMIPLLGNILLLKSLMKEQEEKFKEALVCVFEAVIWCVKQRDPKIFPHFVRFFKSSVDSQRLSSIKEKIESLKLNFNFMATMHQLKHLEVRGISRQGYPENAVGIDEQVAAVIDCISMKTTNDCASWAVVLYGLGGVGKSTIAKAVASLVDRDLYNFARIDLESIGEENSYTDLQKQILNDGFPTYNDGRKIYLSDAADGRDHIREAFKDVEGNKPLFLFIDNVLNKEQLMKILPENLSEIPKGTKILITTRMLQEPGVIENGRGLALKSYKVGKLSDHHARQILFKHPVNAAASVNIVDAAKQIEEIISLCGGIPMVLKVVGGRLRKHDYNADICTEIIKILKTGKQIKEDGLSDRLFESVYKKLEDSAKEAFLDICCCFHEHWLLRHVRYIVGCEDVTSLAEAAFISTAMANQEEMLSVQSLLRGIGLSKSKSSRITDDKYWSEVENDEVTVKKIETICIENKSCRLEKKHFQWMENTLRILSWKGCINIPAKEVRVPQMRCIKTDCNVDWMIVEEDGNLRFLECEKLPIKLSDSLRCVKVKKQPLEMKVFSETVPNCGLKEFSIEFDEGKRTSDEEMDERTSDEEMDKPEDYKNAFNSFFQNLDNLEHLEIIKCPSLLEMPKEVCRSPKLITLRMKSCNQLESLTESFDQLTVLRELCFDNCISLKELPSSFCHLKLLTVLHLLGCQKLETFPGSFGELISLEKLFVYSCENFKELPSTFGQLKTLKQLEIEWCQNLKTFPSSFGELTSLEKLFVDHCENFKELPSTFGQLKTLKQLEIKWCKSFEDLSDKFGELAHLAKLDLVSCTSLKKLPSTFDQLKDLRELIISHCVGLGEDPSIVGNLINSLGRLIFHPGYGSEVCK